MINVLVALDADGSPRMQFQSRARPVKRVANNGMNAGCFTEPIEKGAFGT